MDIHHVRVWPVTIVQSHERNPERAIWLRQIDQATADERAFVHAVKRADDAVRPGEINLQYCSVCEETSEQDEQENRRQPVARTNRAAASRERLHTFPGSG